MVYLSNVEPQKYFNSYGLGDHLVTKGKCQLMEWTLQGKSPPYRGTVAVVQSLSHVQLFATP